MGWPKMSSYGAERYRSRVERCIAPPRRTGPAAPRLTSKTAATALVEVRQFPSNTYSTNSVGQRQFFLQGANANFLAWQPPIQTDP
jgi:hypothetical protein